MTTPQIDVPGTPPDPLAPQPTFRATFYAYLQQLVAAFGQANTVATWMNGTAETVATNATNANNAATSAQAARDIAVGAANFTGEYDPATFYAIGESVSYLGSQFVKKTTAPAGTEPVDGVDWLEINLTDGVVGDIAHSLGNLPEPWLVANGGTLTKLAQPGLATIMGPQWPYELNVQYGLANPIPSSGCESVTFFGDYIALGSQGSPYIHIYDWNNGSLIKMNNPAALPAGYARDVAYSPDGDYLSVAHDTSPFVTFYDNSTPSAPVKLANPASLPHASCYSVSWTSDSRYCAVAVYGSNSAERVRIYDFQSGAPVVTGGIDVDLTGTGWDALYSPDDQFLVAGMGSAPWIHFYNATNPGTPTKIADPATLPTSIVRKVSWSPDSRYVAASTGSSSGVLIYDMQSGSPVYVGAANNSADARSFWLDNTTFAVPASTTRVYRIDGSTISELYSVLSSSQTFGFNPRRMIKREVGLDKHILVASLSSPYLTFQPQSIDPETEFRLPLIEVASETFDFGNDPVVNKITTFIRGE